MANSTIVSVRVAQRFDIGQTLYYSDSGYPESVMVHSKPYFKPFIPGHASGCWRMDILDVTAGCIRSIALGDAGVKGYAYDDRPCKLSKSYIDGLQAVKAYDAWSMDLDRFF